MSAAITLTLIACVTAAAALLAALQARAAGGSVRRRPRRCSGNDRTAGAARWGTLRVGEEAEERALDAAGRARGVATVA
ncbi:MAG: hypothetical protein QM679_10045, partial [Patulibacter sp.]